jgi:hypothetical protein
MEADIGFMTLRNGFLQFCLSSLALSLLLVGVVSGTPLRHLIQATPVIVAVGCVWRRFGWSAYAALPLFLFWLLIASLIGLFLFGYAHIINGKFSPIERLLTAVIWVSCLLGIGAAFRALAGHPWWSRVAAFLVFAGFAVAAMWASLQPAVARR